MMKTMNQSPRCARALSPVLRYSTVFLLAAALVAAQSKITKPPAQTNSNGSGKRTHVATLRSSDSSEGSRVALSSDQSLNDYEAYRRGDRFYVKIPAAEVPRAEAVRGRGFADVKTQRSGDSTVLSFRLQPGATARVEQRSNRLDVVFTVPGSNTSTASKSVRESPRPAESNRNLNANKQNTAQSTANKNSAAKNSNSAAKNPNDRPASARTGNANSNSASKTGPAALNANSGSKPAATPLPSPVSSPVATPPKQTLAQKGPLTASPSPTTQPTPATANQSTQDRWGQMKERLHYWILLAQLNPIPVATGAAVLLLLFALFLFQRRRVKSPRRARPSIIKSSKTRTTTDAGSSASSTSDLESAEVSPVVGAAAVVPAVIAATTKPEAAVKEPAPDSDPSPTGDPRRERIAQVGEETKKLVNGGSYDEGVIGSDDRETRQLVGAELLSALVGRSATRREHARAAFMKHGYFDDATRDLRISDSANERAAAARRLSFVHDREATPHLIGALDDPSPDVRRAAVEALMDLRDPAAIAPLNSLMQTENDRKVPRTVIKHAIEACATAAPDEVPSVAPSHTPEGIPNPSSQPIQTEREVIEL
jgi:hypothetical protein